MRSGHIAQGEELQKNVRQLEETRSSLGTIFLTSGSRLATLLVILSVLQLMMTMVKLWIRLL